MKFSNTKSKEPTSALKEEVNNTSKLIVFAEEKRLSQSKAQELFNDELAKLNSKHESKHYNQNRAPKQKVRKAISL
jgi:hypothetical protein